MFDTEVGIKGFKTGKHHGSCETIPKELQDREGHFETKSPPVPQ